MQQLQDHNVFGPALQAFLQEQNGRDNGNTTYENVGGRTLGDHFAGVNVGVNWELTTTLLLQWTEKAD